jgi:hypothetical protein
MTFQLRIDKNSFQFHIIFLGMNPIKDVFAARHNPPWPSRLHTQSAVRRGFRAVETIASISTPAATSENDTSSYGSPNLLPVRASPEDPSADAGLTEPADRSRSHCHARPRAIGGIENLTASCGF